MKRTMRGGFVVSGLACAALFATTVPAIAVAAEPQQDEVVIVDKPDTDGLNNMWTFAPLGVPVFGLVDSVVDVLSKLF